CWTRSPRWLDGMPSCCLAWGLRSVSGILEMPSAGWRYRPLWISSGTTRLTTLIGIANPMPSFPPDCDRIALVTPITCPLELNNGPPELPGLIAASVCRAPAEQVELRGDLTRRGLVARVSTGAHNALGYRLLQTEGRADRDRCFADRHLAGVAQYDRLEAAADWVALVVGAAGVHLNNGQVVVRVAAKQLGSHGRPVLAGDRELVRVLDHVVVGNDAALVVDDEPRTDALRL